MQTKNYGPTAVVVAYNPPRPHHDVGTVEVLCPWCRKRDRWNRPTDEPSSHWHGVGQAGQLATLDRSRVAHCGTGAVYGLADPEHLVPARLVMAEPDLEVTA